MKRGKKRVHRLVVLPDYQGIGIGTRFIKEVAKIITDRGYELNLTTTTPALIHSLIKDNDWVLARYGREKSGMTGYDRYKNMELKHLKNAVSQKRITYSFWYRKAVDDGETNELK